MPYVAPIVWGDPSYMFSASQQLVALAEAYVSQLTSVAAGLVPPSINVTFPSVPGSPFPGSVPTPPLQTVTWTVPGQPPPFNGQVDISGILIPPFTGVAPTLNFGSAPPPFLGVVPTAPPINLDFIYPVVSVKLPNPPTLLSLDTVDFPTLTIPTFDAKVPTFTAVEPAPFNYVPGDLYTSKLLTDLEDDLDAAITTGEYTHLDKQAQEALWDTGREREYRQQAVALVELNNRAEVLGYALPPGSFIDSRIKIQTDTNYTIANLSRDIMTKQAELQLTNIVKARESAVQLEYRLIQYANETAQRTFEAAKYATESGIAIYNAKVQAYTASLEGYKAQALVYEAQIKGIMAQVQIIQAQVEYEKTKADINTSIVKQYEVEVQAQLAILQIYKTQVEIIQTQAQVEKIKVDIYGAEIQAFVGQINAYTAEVQGYKASIEAQATIEQAYKTSVDAYTAEVNAGVAQLNARVAVFHSQVEAYQAQLAGYDSAIKGMVGQAQAASEYDTAIAAVFSAQVAAMQSYNEVLTKQWEAIINEQAQIEQIAVSEAKANGDLYIAARGLSLDASKVGAQVCAQLGAAALGAISWHNSSQWSSNMQSSDGNTVSMNTGYNNNNTTANTNSNTSSTNFNNSNNESTSQNESQNNSQNYNQNYNDSYNESYNQGYNNSYNQNYSQNSSQNDSQVNNQTSSQINNQTDSQVNNQTTNEITTEANNENTSNVTSTINSTSTNTNNNTNSSS